MSAMTALPPGAKRADVPDPDALRDAVVAAARAWKQARRTEGRASWLEVVGAATRLERAVDAYEAALPPGAA